MGKKSRRHRNKKTGNGAASASASNSATATATTTEVVSPYSASSGTNPCYHGSTADKFQPGSEYLKAVEEYLDTIRQMNLLNIQDGSHVQQAGIFEEDHKHLMKDPEFSRFIFAFCTQQYLEGNFLFLSKVTLKIKPRLSPLHTILVLGIGCRYGADLEKEDKYLRDAFTERGIINILFRETTTHCPCMNEAKDIAKKMDKEAMCNGCNLIFPKETLRPCTGCQKVDYHNRKCQSNHWPEHRSDCKSFKIEQDKSKIIEQCESIEGMFFGMVIIFALVSFFFDFDFFCDVVLFCHIAN